MTDIITDQISDTDAIDKLCAKVGRPERKAERYIAFCLANEQPRLPNMAGFFRWMGLSASARDHFKGSYPQIYRTVKMIFEDEALNSPLPPSIVSAYMKQFFSSEDVTPEDSSRGITLVFEHDIERDGE